MGRSASGSGSINQFFTTVSPVGFTAGDLIYNTPQGIGPITASPTGTATFAASSTAPYAPIGSPTQAGVLKYVEPYGGITTAQGVATLTNGNILIAYGRRFNATNTADVCFKVVDTSDNVVVAETLVSAAQNINSGTPVGALALPNGTFAVIWIGNSGGNQRLFTAIYNNNGTVVTAATADTSVVANGSIPQLAFAARSDSSFVVAFTNSSQVPVYRVYSSTGATVYSGTWASGFGNAGNNSILSAVVRSDNSFVLTASDPVSVNIYYIVLSATNTTLANTSFSAPGNAFGHKAILQPTDVVRFVFFCDNGILTRTLTGTTLGGQATLRSVFLNQFNGFSCGTINGSGDFIVTFSASPNTYANNTLYGNTKLMYEVFNAAGTSLAGPIRLKAMNNYSQGAMANILVVGSEIRIYKSSTTQANGQHMFYPRGIYYARLNSTTYVANPFNTLPIALPSITTSSGAYVKSASTINSAVFFPATTTTNAITVGPSTSTASSQLLPQTNVSAISTLSPNVVTLANGNIAVIWQQNGSGNGVFYSILNAQGVVQTTVTVSATVSSPWFLGTRIIQTSNGNIVACWRDGNIIYFRIYSSSNVLLNSGNVPNSIRADTPTWSVSPLGQNGLFVFCYNDGNNYLSWSVYSATGTNLQNGTEPNTYSFQSANVVGFRSGDFVVYGGTPSLGQTRCYVYGRNGSDSSYALMYGDVLVSNGWSPVYNNGNVSLTPDDIAILYGFDGSASIQSVAITPEWPANTNLFYRSISGNLYSTSSGQSLSIGVTSNGDPVATTFAATPNFYTNTQAGSSVINYSYTASPVSLGGDSANDANSGLSIAPYVGDAVVMSYRSTAGGTRIVIYYGASSTFSVTLTAGVTQSFPIPLSYAARIAFMGVALTNCSVGGAGVIQTRGTALVSTSYPSMAASTFDFRNNTTYGVSGSVSGRIVTIEG